MVPTFWLQPVYPKKALEKNVGGKVRLVRWSRRTGRCGAVAPVDGDRELLDAAKDALRDWTFVPCSIAGKATEVALPPIERVRASAGVLIGRDGGTRVLEVLSGPEELVPEAVEAVKQWRYKPYWLNRATVEVDTRVAINFRLGF